MDILGFFTGAGGWLAAVAAAVAAIFALMAKSRRDGKREAESAHERADADRVVRETAAVAERQESTLKGTDDAKSSVTSLPDGDADRQLRDKWQRPE